MIAKIFQPAKTAMQSGRAKTTHWVIEFEAGAARRIDPLMGWTSSSETTSNQVRLTFGTKEAAIAYVEARKIPYRIEEPRAAAPVIKAYSDNFASSRRKPWTH